jgi:hypothetical protein
MRSGTSGDAVAVASTTRTTIRRRCGESERLGVIRCAETGGEGSVEEEQKQDTSLLGRVQDEKNEEESFESVCRDW